MLILGNSSRVRRLVVSIVIGGIILIIAAVAYDKFHYQITPSDVTQVSSTEATSSTRMFLSASTSSSSTLITISHPAPATKATTADLLKNMHLTFSDDFNSFSRYTDSNGNVTCKSGGMGTWQTVYYFCSRTNEANNEAEVYTDPSFYAYLLKESLATAEASSSNPFKITNGVLSITASPSSTQVLKAVGPWATFTSGMITTQFSFSQTYGYFEARMELPAGQGLWPAFWLLPEDGSWPPEVDAMEAFGATSSAGQGGLTSIHYASHANIANNSCGDWHNVGVNITQGFHTYGVDIEPTSITYYFDGTAYATCPPNPQLDKPLYMLLNLAVGGPNSWPGVAPTDSKPAELLIDYVRAYQKNSL
jgi:beta-glucanase (GH16 family)